MAFLKSIDGSVLALPNLWQTWIWNKPACCAGCSLSTEVLVHRNHQIGLFFFCMVFCESAAIFLVIATVKTRYDLKRAWQGLSMEGLTNLKRSRGKNHFLLMIWKHEFFIMTLWPFPIQISFPLKALSCSFQNVFFYRTLFLCTGMTSYQWLDLTVCIKIKIGFHQKFW